MNIFMFMGKTFYTIAKQDILEKSYKFLIIKSLLISRVFKISKISISNFFSLNIANISGITPREKN